MCLHIIYCQNFRALKIAIYLSYVFSGKKRQPNWKELIKEEVAEQKKKEYFFRIWSLTPLKSVLVMHS